jgi:hypothetical protein
MKPLQRLAIACLCIGFVFLSGCTDWYSDPELLADQKALSEVYADRPLYAYVYYEGRTQVEGTDMHVFVVKATSKFTSAASYWVYYLPVSNMVIETSAGPYEGKGKLKQIYRLKYDHDEGQFRLLENNKRMEVIKTNFTETYSFKQTKCLKAAKDAAAGPDSYKLVNYAAEICFWSGDFEQSKVFTQQLKDNMSNFDRYTTDGQMLHDYYTIMGRHLLREGQTQEAKTYLLQSIDVRPSPVMTSFGPNMELAMDLLKAGETAAVIKYLDGCAEFWNDEPVQIWKQKINEGRMPVLNQHSWDGEL